MNEFWYDTVSSSAEKQILCTKMYVFIFIVSFTARGTFSALYYYVALIFRIFTTSFGRVNRHFEFWFSLVCFLAFFWVGKVEVDLDLRWGCKILYGFLSLRTLF